MNSLGSEKMARALAARRERTEVVLGRLKETLDAMVQESQPFNMMAVARRSQVSRTFLYENPNARALVQQALAKAPDHSLRTCLQHGPLVEKWRARAITAEGDLEALQVVAESLRQQIADREQTIRRLVQT